jgi:Flp pilus assembly protein TadB
MRALFVFQMIFGISALLSGARMLWIYEKKEILSPKSRNILASLMFACAFAMFFLQFSPLMFVVGTIFHLLVTFGAVFFIAKSASGNFDKSILYFLDLILLEMKAGASLRESLKRVIASESRPEVKALQQILNRLEFDLQTIFFQNAKMESLFQEIKSLEALPFRTIERLESFRLRIQKELYYRQKSSQVSLQTRAQSLVISLLFIAVMIYVIYRFGFRENMQLILIATALFLTGLFWIFQVGAKIKWKI